MNERKIGFAKLSEVTTLPFFRECFRLDSYSFWSKISVKKKSDFAVGEMNTDTSYFSHYFLVFLLERRLPHCTQGVNWFY